MSTVILASVVTDNPEHAAKAAEVLARALAGLALEGITVGLNMSQQEDEESETEQPMPE